LAEGILRRQATERGIEVEVDSAGTGDWHAGDLPDYRARQTGQRRGCNMDMRARQMRARDFQDFDLIVALDQMNLRDLQRWPGSIHDKIRLARSFDPSAEHMDVPDPYYGSIEDFEKVGDMLERACEGLLDYLAEARPVAQD
jgi:protein-tyrosine phosphatase